MKAGSILIRQSLREMKKNRLQFASMIAITMLAVTLFCGFLSNTKTLRKATDDYFGAANLYDLCVQTSGLKETDREYFSSLDGAETEFRVYAEGSINEKNAKLYVGDNTIAAPVVTEGEAGVLMSARNAELDGFEIGDTVSVTVDNVPLAGTLKIDVQITGMMTLAELVSSTSTTAVYITEERFNEILAEKFPTLASVIKVENFYTQALVKTDTPAELKEAINARYAGDDSLLFVYDRESTEAVVLLDGEVEQSRKMLYVFPVIFLVVSVFVILTTVNRLILEQRTEIGTLKGLGFGKGEILLHYAWFGGTLCFVGGVIGAILGPLIVPNVMKIKYRLVYGLAFPSFPLVHVTGTVLSVLGVALLAAFISVLVCRGVVKESPSACMRPAPPKSRLFLRPGRSAFGKRGGAEREETEELATASDLSATRKGGKVGGGKAVKPLKIRGAPKDAVLSLKMALRNIAIKPLRALMTVLGITGCVALLMCAFGIGDTIDNSLHTEFYGQFSYDVSTTYEKDGFAEEMEKLKASGDIVAYETYDVHYMTVSAGKESKDVRVYDFSPGMTMTTIDTSGGKTAVSASVADYLGLKEGGTFTLSYGGRNFTFTADLIVETAITKGVFVETDALADVYGTPSAWIKADCVTEELLAKIDEASGGHAESVGELWNYVEEKVSSVNTMKYTVMVFAILLSVVVLYNLSLLNVNERTRDIATLKVLGFTRAKISLSLLLEIMTLTLVGTAFGLLLGYPVTYLVMSINSVEIMSFLYALRPVSYLLSAALSVVTALVINLIFGRTLGRINMIEALKSVE